MQKTMSIEPVNLSLFQRARRLERDNERLANENAQLRAQLRHYRAQNNARYRSRLRANRLLEENAGYFVAALIAALALLAVTYGVQNLLFTIWGVNV
ncbi:MAG: hypothetical protein IJ381_01805 [Clostridia bacterium]|nr:hypothetical protein [Clostridia bacterium]